MAEVVLFHHIQGLTTGVRAFADQLQAGGHTVHTPDLFNGEIAASIEDGAALVAHRGRETLTARPPSALAPLPAAVVYAGG